MTTDPHIIAIAERLFDDGGFEATGMDRLTRAAGVSSRTLYKRIGSKSALIGEVLRARDERFRARLDVDSIDALFVALECWLRVEGTRGCLFLRALGESGGHDRGVAERVAAHKAAVREIIGRLVATELGVRDDIADQLQVLFEGATADAVRAGPAAARAARCAAATLLATASGS